VFGGCRSVTAKGGVLGLSERLSARPEPCPRSDTPAAGRRRRKLAASDAYDRRELYEPRCCGGLTRSYPWNAGPQPAGQVSSRRYLPTGRAVLSLAAGQGSAGLLAVKAKPLRGGLRPALTAPAPRGTGSYARNREKTDQKPQILRWHCPDVFSRLS
jgi:hypothetical protein